MLRGDERSHHGGGVTTGTDDHVRDPRGDGLDELVGDGSDRDDDRDRHAPLAGRPVRRRHRRVGRGVEVGIGKDHHVVLRAAEGLHALAVARPGLVDVTRHRRAPDEGDRGDVAVGQQRVHRLAVTLHHVEDTVGKAGPAHEVGQEERGGRVLLRRLQHEAVAAGDGVGHHPQGNHDREVERRDAGHDPDRLEHRADVDARGDLRIGSSPSDGSGCHRRTRRSRCHGRPRPVRPPAPFRARASRPPRARPGWRRAARAAGTEVRCAW